MTENSQPPLDNDQRGNKFFAIFKKVNIFGHSKKEAVTNGTGEKQKNVDELLVESLNTKRLPSWKQIKYLP
ncbi:MAG TPA: hypothetical protein P5267_01860, partial [Patescibacteria group bacterium]|nr:hypothetical protein [Patescibacteria group bacterium]